MSRKIETAEMFLVEQLFWHSVPSNELYRRARDAGISQRTLERAKITLGVRAIREGAPGRARGAGRWTWEWTQ